MNIYQTGDSHFGRTSSSKELNNPYVNFPVHSKAIDTYEALAYMLNIAKADSGEKVLFLTGDQFQDAKVHEIYHFFFKKFLIEALEIFDEVWCIPGNHDVNSSLNCSMDSYRAMKHPKFKLVMDIPQVLTLKNVSFFVLPYSPQLYRMTVNQFEKIIKEWVDKDNSTFLISHFWLTGARMDSDYTVRLTSTLEDSIFDKYKRIFLGHIHKHQILKDKTIYAGSILQNTRGEKESDKGFIIYNLENNTTEFKQVPQKRQYIDVDYDEIETYQFTKDDIYTIIIDIKSQKFSDFHTVKERMKFFTKECFLVEPEYIDSSRMELDKRNTKKLENKHYSNDWSKLFTNYVDTLGNLPLKTEVISKGLDVIANCS